MAERWKRLAPLSGVVFVGLVLASIMVSDSQPGVDDGPAKVLAYYNSHHGRTTAQIVMMAYAALFAIVYYTSVAQFLRARGAQTMATLTLVGGAVFAVGCGLLAGVTAALDEAIGHFNGDQMQVLNAIAMDLFWPLMIAGTALATLAMGVSMLRTHALPKWLGIVTLIVGIVLISGIVSWIGFMATGPLTLVIAGYVYARLGRSEAISLPEMPGQRANADVSTSDKTPAS